MESSVKRPWVLVDISYLAYRALHSVGHLAHEDFPTGIIFGFFTQLRMICQDQRVLSNKVALFFDSRDSFRRDVYPAYKAKRRAQTDEVKKEQIGLMWKQVRILQKEVLPALGIACYQQRGVESDDLLAQAAKQITHLASCFGPGGRSRQAILVTSDGDLFQCINPYIHWYDPGRQVYHTPASFKVTRGVHPKVWGWVKSLAGCSSDNVAGIPGVGEATAIKFIKGELPTHHKTFRAIDCPRGAKIQKRNGKLVILPHKRTKSFKLVEPDYNVDAFFKACERYGLRSFLQQRVGWTHFFTGKQHPTLRRRGEG